MRGFAFIVFGLAASFLGAQHQAEVLELLRSTEWEKSKQRFLLDRDSLMPDVIAALKHEDAKVRARAAEAVRVVDSHQARRTDPEQGLGKHRKAAIDALLISAKDPEAEVQQEAIWALAYLCRVRKFGHHGDTVMEPEAHAPLFKLGMEATPALGRLLGLQRKDDLALHGAKLVAVHALRSNKDRRAVEPLIALVAHAQGFLLLDAMVTLATYDDPRVPQCIVDVIQRDIPGYGMTPSMWVIRDHLKHRAVPALVRAVVEHPDVIARQNCAQMLIGLPDKRAIKALQKATEDENAIVRRNAAYALGANIDRSNVSVLRKLLNDPDEQVREAAMISLNLHTNP